MLQTLDRTDEARQYIEFCIKGNIRIAAHDIFTKFRIDLPDATKLIAEVKSIEEAPQPITEQDAAAITEPETPAPPQKSNIQTIAERSIARGENRVLPIAVGGKNPAISWKNSPIDAASTSEWAGLAQSWIDSLDQQFPELNACVIAKPDEYVFIDNDTAKEFREGYEKFSGEKYPETFTTSATPNHYQEHFRQTDLTRTMGNIVQFSVDGISLSVRQRNLYVLAEGSRHPSGRIYEVVVDADIIPMPDKMAEYIQHLDKKAHQDTTRPSSGSSQDDWIPIDITVEGAPIPHGQHDSALFKIASSLRQRKWDRQDALEHLTKVCEARCVSYGSDYRDMCEKKIGSAWKYEVKESGKIEFPVQAPVPTQTATEDLSWLDLSEVAARPIFPDWILKGTSLYEGLAKPVSDVNSKVPELIWLPAVQLMLNYLHNKVSINGMRLNVNMFLGLISSPGKFFKSSSCRLAHEYFGHVGLAVNLTPSLRNSEGKIVIGQAGSSEGFGLQLQNANAKHATLFNDELGKLVSKAGIENSSLPHDLLSWYESNDFSNPIKNGRQSFAFPAGTYCFGWQFCTTIRGFNNQWSRLAGIASGMPDRTFFLITPEEPKPLSGEVFVNTVEKATETRKLIDRAIEKKEYQISDYAKDSLLKKSAAFGDPRSMNMVYKFALYFAIDLGLDEIDEDCIARALALVDYRQKAVTFLQPIEAKNDEGRLLQEILRELRQHGGKMTRREFNQNMHPQEYGDRFWNNVYGSAIKADRIREFNEPGARGQTRKMIGLVKEDVRWGPAE
jgi:hypothetical protein